MAKKKVTPSCPYNIGVEMTASCAGHCPRCGWNPVVAAERKTKLNATYTRAKA